VRLSRATRPLWPWSGREHGCKRSRRAQGRGGRAGVPLRACAAAGGGGLAAQGHHRADQGPARQRLGVRVLLGVRDDRDCRVHGGHGHRQGALAERAAGARPGPALPSAWVAHVCISLPHCWSASEQQVRGRPGTFRCVKLRTCKISPHRWSASEQQVRGRAGASRCVNLRYLKTLPHSWSATVVILCICISLPHCWSETVGEVWFRREGLATGRLSGRAARQALSTSVARSCARRWHASMYAAS